MVREGRARWGEGVKEGQKEEEGYRERVRVSVCVREQKRGVHWLITTPCTTASCLKLLSRKKIPYGYSLTHSCCKCVVHCVVWPYTI